MQSPEIQKQLDKVFRKEEKSFFGFFIKNYRFTYLIIFASIVLGFFFLLTMPREADPEVKVPFASVLTIYPGANPNDVEELITNKLEEKIKDIDNLNKFSSSSGMGFSSIFVEFEAEADITSSMQKLRDATNQAKAQLPQESEEPIVSEINITDIPIVTYSLVGNFSDAELKEYADTLKQEFKSIKSVSRVNILGGLEKEIQVIVNQTSLANFNISLSQIINAIKSNNINLPIGDIEIDNLEYNIRAQGKYVNPENLGDIVVATYQNSPIYLREIAQINNTFKKQDTKSRIGTKEELPKNTISLQIFKKTGGNILSIVGDSQNAIKKLQENENIPASLEVLKTNDNAAYIRKDIKTLGTSGLQTMVLIIIILFIAIGFRASIITSFSVPMAFLMAFIFLAAQDMTLNGMVLFSLVLSLGLMVDNSIVIIEGINEYSNKYKQSAYKASLLSIANYKWPIIAGTMTTISAFLPMLLVSGIMGQYLSIMPITISATLFSSLFVALVIIPTLSYRFVKKKNSNNDFNHEIQILSKFKIKYEELLRKVFLNKRKRRLSLGAVWALFIIAVLIPAQGLMPIQMFPRVDIDYFVVNVELPIGSTLEQTSAIVSEIENKITKLPELDNFVTNIGTSASVGITDNQGGDGSHLASITVNLVDSGERKRASYEISQVMRDNLKSFTSAKITIEELSAGPPTGAPIEIRISGKNQDELSKALKQVKDIFSQIPGVINIKDNLEDSPGEFVFSFDQAKLNYYGLTTVSAASAVRSAVHGTKAGEVLQSGDDIDITVKYSEKEFQNVNDLRDILIFTSKGNINLAEIAKIEIKPALLSIRHKDGNNVIILRADTETGVNLTEVLATFQNKLKEFNFSNDIKIETGGEVEDIDKSFRETFLSMIVAVLLISIILVLIFNSFRQPLIIIFTLPLAVIGVIFGLLLLGMPFSFTAFIGIVALSGIVVNDAIILIDRINKNLKAGVDFTESIVESGIARMQPILLTSLTTIAGIFPLIYADELWRGFSISVIFGLMFATILTLFVIPVMFYVLCHKR